MALPWASALLAFRPEASKRVSISNRLFCHSFFIGEILIEWGATPPSLCIRLCYKWGKQKRFSQIFREVSGVFQQNFNCSKNSAVLEPRTGQFSRTWGFEAKAKDFKMCPRGRPRGQVRSRGLHLWALAWCLRKLTNVFVIMWRIQIEFWKNLTSVCTNIFWWLLQSLPVLLNPITESFFFRKHSFLGEFGFCLNVFGRFIWWHRF